MSTHARPLADRLAAASDAQLERMLRERGVRPDAGWTDFFDAAEALLEPASIERALAALTLVEARAVRAAAIAEAPVELGDAGMGLLDQDGRVLPPVRALVEARDELPDADGAEPARASADDSARAAERAFATVGGLAELLLAARSAPLSLVATGALSATEKRRLPHGGELDELRDLAELTGLARRVDRELRLTADAEDWLDASFPDRWTMVATGLRDALPPGVAQDAAADWPLAYPWDPHWPGRAERLRTLAWRIGVLAGGDGVWPVPEWGLPLHTAERFDSAALQALLPSEVDRIFLQNDLSAIAPGPLHPLLDNRLRAMTEHDAAQASSYRFTAESVARALVEGDTAEGILSFLSDISLTGVPQPLEYLVGQTAARHGLVRVRPNSDGVTTVTSGDPHLLDAMEIDRNLRPLGLIREGDRLITRVGAEAVAWALADARYPATLIDASGRSVAAGRARIAVDAPADDGRYAALIARLRASHGPDADAAWLDRELEAAVRAKAVLLVEVAMPDGSLRELALEAAGLGGGRLRGRDRAADVERTLPVRSIVSVRVVQD